MAMNMKKTDENASCMGIYLSTEAITVAELQMQNGQIKTNHFVRVPFSTEQKEQTQRGGINTAFFGPDAKWPDILGQIIGQVAWKKKQAVVSLSAQFDISRYFLMPKVERRFLKQSVALEAKKYIP